MLKFDSRQLVMYVIFDFKEVYFVEKQGFRIIFSIKDRQNKRHSYGGKRKRGI